MNKEKKMGNPEDQKQNKSIPTTGQEIPHSDTEFLKDFANLINSVSEELCKKSEFNPNQTVDENISALQEITKEGKKIEKEILKTSTEIEQELNKASYFLNPSPSIIEKYVTPINNNNSNYHNSSNKGNRENPLPRKSSPILTAKNENSNRNISNFKI